tara:strand:- start:61 stop:1917 length:1857 start_codon:yes stop_codon:yes gene_type:complete
MVSEAGRGGQDAEHLDKKAQEEIKKKLAKLKTKVESFNKKVLAKHKKDVVGICLLPPERFEDVVNRLRTENLTEEELRKRIKEEKEKINVMMLLDDKDTKDTKEKISMLKKIEGDSKKIASDVDKLIKPQCILMSEIREACSEGKYELLRLISLGIHMYDQKDVLAAIKISELHKSMVIRKFEKYVVSYIAVGSLFRGDASSHDIDVAVIIDDTDVRRMSRAELKTKLGGIIRGMGHEASIISKVKKAFHIQVYILTDFWDSIRDASPVIFTFLRDGIPLYDRGVFTPQKLLLNMGRIRPSPEAIDMHLDVGERLLDRAKGKLISIVIEDIYYAALNPSQSALMLQGYPPSTPKETIRLIDEVFVKKLKLMTVSDVSKLKRAFQVYKDIEHGKTKEISGKDVDSLMNDVAEYVKKIKSMVKNMEKKSLKQSASDLINSINETLTALMGAEGISTEKSKLIQNFSKLVSKGHFNKKDMDLLKRTIEGVSKASSKEELDKFRRESSLLRKRLFEHIQLKRGREIDRARIRVKYGDQFGDVYLLDGIAFMVGDIDAKTKAVSKAKITSNGRLGDVQPSTLEELDKALATAEKIPEKVFIKEKLFEGLKRIYGKNVEIMLSY